MRILIVSDTSGYMRGGVPAETVQLIKGLSSRGHEVGMAGDVIPKGGESAAHHRITLPTSPALAEELGLILRKFQPDFVHVMNMSSRGINWIAPVLAGTPWVMTCHSLPPHERKLSYFHGNESLHYGARWLRFAPNTFLWKQVFTRRIVPHVIVHSAMAEKVVTVGFAHPGQRTSLIPLACELPDRPSEGEAATSLQPPLRMLTVGGIAHTKGQHDVVTAMGRLATEHPAITYRMIGEVRDSSYVRFLEKRIAELDLATRVMITPDASNEEKRRALAEAHIYVQPSHEEGFCLAYLEGAHVVPRLLGCDTGAIRQISGSDPAARVVPVKSPMALAAALSELIGAPMPAGYMAERTDRLRDEFSWKRYLDSHEALYQRLGAR